MFLSPLLILISSFAWAMMSSSRQRFRHRLGGHGFRLGHELQNLRDAVLEFHAFLGDQGRVRRHAGQDADFVGFLNIRDIGSIDEKFHGKRPPIRLV